ncbi:MAG: aconitase family protein, partial [Alphaproteobacteria bacterium]|nr:aconitase family protein [Alphaproteobacteria bacterium]
MLENLLRYEDEKNITQDDMRALTAYHALHKNIPTISFHPARFLIDAPAALSIMTDLAVLHEAISTNAIAPTNIECPYPTDIVMAPSQETSDQQAERYRLIKWGEKTITNVHVIPPGHGPSNHISLNALGSVVRIATFEESDAPLVIPDTVVGTDPYFSTINGLGILGWNTDSLEIQSLILGHTSRLSLPGVVGVKLTGKIHKGTTATDLALAITAVVSNNDP